ncbi:two-component regulator propeller domain-containing protein [Seonamhaeicola sp. ML3]|uniref:two-component regulator propeller domain-containing protein n=1 Tax=Seonamhaeicola sp. ML3 TaxID=2937786 RepID=UPI00200F0CBA|nr:two-component regulator propeller domain-containing protein [Seonamhaeicola sp. ML3]
MRKIFIFLLIFCSGFVGSGQNGVSYQFNHLSTADGLSQSSAIAIHQDRLGQMWIGTRDGLNKYDGTKFSIYRNQENNPYSISNNDILSIQEDDSGNLWVGTYNGLNRYNPKTDQFESYFHDEFNSSLSNNTVWSIRKLSNGAIWVGTWRGLSVYDEKTNSFHNYLDNQGRPAKMKVMAILETKSGRIFIGTGAGVFEANYEEGKLLGLEILPGSESYHVQDLAEDESANLLLGTKDDGLIRYSLKSKAYSPFFKKETTLKSIKSIRKLLFDNQGVLWIGTYEGLITVNKNGAIELLQADLDNKKGLSKNSIKSLFKDNKGSVWIGTYYGGVNIWDTSNSNFENIIQNQKGKGLNYTVVSSIESYGDYVFFGTEGGGLNIWNKTNNSYKYLTETNSRLIDNNIKALEILDSTKLWIGTFKTGLQIYDADKRRFESITLPKELADLLKNAGVYTIKKDTENNLWIGTFGKGLIKYNHGLQEFSHFQSSNEGVNDLSNNLIRTILIDKKSNVWVGTENGLNKITESSQITNFFYDKTLQYGDDILSIHQDLNETIWVGTKSKGLFKYNGEGFDAVSFNLEDTKISAIRSIQEDNQKQLWIGTNQGILKYNPKIGDVKIYNETDGVISNEFNDNAILKLNDTEFYFGGPNGVTRLNTERITINEHAPQVILTDFLIRESDSKKNSSIDVLKYTLPFTESVELDYDQGNFSISFSIPSFVNSSNNSYRYRLRGLEKEWNSTSNNSASYTIQNPGDYVFEVMGANNDKVWNGTTTSLRICVAPAPWRTWWAFTIYGLLILVSLFFLFRILKSRTRLLHELELEHLETERTKEVNQTKLEFFTNISHEFRTPLALILGPLGQIIEDYRGSSKMYKKLLVIENSANHLLQLINRLMDFRKFEKKLFTLEAAEGNIVKFLREIYLSFTEHAKTGGYNFNFITDEDEILVYYDRNKLERVFYNLISNAFRYTPKGGDINIRILRKEHQIIINVEDSGVGIAEEFQDKIFERFFEVAVNNKPDQSYNKGTGIGLSIAKNIVELHKGEIALNKNENNIGSVFSVMLKLGKSHLTEDEILQDYKFSDDLSQYVKQLEESPEVVLNDDLDSVDETDKSTILLVEDNKPLRKFIKSTLLPYYKVLEAENGKVAFKVAKKESPDLIVSDVIMPEMTGTELCAAVKGDLKTSHIPIILLTSRTSLIYKLNGLESGADDYINKPFDVKEFKLRIKNILHNREKLKQKFANSEGVLPDEVLVSSFDEKLYQKALNIVKENVGNEDFDIAMFCSELGVSRTMLFTKIKAWSNFTPNEFILHFRMKRAAQYLEQGKLNISQICYKVGYKNPKYFSKTFQKKFGETPSQYASKFSD